MRDRGQYIAMLSPEAAAAFEMTPAERVRAERIKEIALYGLAGDVAAKMRALATELQVDEIAITTYAYDPVARRKSYSLLAREFGLSGMEAAS